MRPATAYRSGAQKGKVADTTTSKWMCGVTMTLDRIRNESILRGGSRATGKTKDDWFEMVFESRNNDEIVEKTNEI